MNWEAEFIETYLWMKADERVAALSQAGQTVLVVWDESVIEKPESLHLEGLCAVRSSKAGRLKRIKPGYFNPPGGRPIFVPGYHWLQVLVTGMEGPLTLANMQWWGQQVLHIWDRGFSGAPWLELSYVHVVRFVRRWPKHYLLLHELGQERKAWQITRGITLLGASYVVGCTPSLPM